MLIFEIFNLTPTDIFTRIYVAVKNTDIGLAETGSRRRHWCWNYKGKTRLSIHMYSTRENGVQCNCSRRDFGSSTEINWIEFVSL